MTLSITLTARAAALDGFETRMVSGAGQATLTIYQTNIALAVFSLGASGSGVPFSAASSDAMAMNNVPLDSTGVEVAGTANRFVIQNQDPADMLSGTISGIGGGGDIETPNLAVTAAAAQRINSFVIRMASNGALSVEGSLTLV